MSEYYLPSEWHCQSLIQLTWPHAGTDWNYILHEVEDCYLHITREIVKREPLLIVSPEVDSVKCFLTKNNVEVGNIIFFECDTNDTWARDHGFITLLNKKGTPLLLDFRFNGWGLKFAANKDNQINSKLYRSGLLNGAYKDCRNYVLEGGSIESDGKGTLLTTTECLLSPNRNDTLDVHEIESFLKERFGLKQVLWLRHGYLAGDDTDSHVDTLARLCPNDTIVYVKCTDARDEHYNALKLMEEELKNFRTLCGQPFRLLPLPMADEVCDKEGNRLPATYANFLIMNEAVLYPTYNQVANDTKAKEILTEAFPDKDIVGINCLALIQQHGSLHCSTMQFPEGVYIKKWKESLK